MAASKLSHFFEAKCERTNLVLRREEGEPLDERGLKAWDVGDGAGAVLRGRRHAALGGSGGRGGGESGGGGPKEPVDNLGISIVSVPFPSNAGGDSSPSSILSRGGASESELESSEEDRLDSSSLIAVWSCVCGRLSFSAPEMS